MKNIFFLIILLCSMFIIGCRTYKAEKQSTDTVQKTTDTIWVDRTLPIHDTLYIPITPPHTGNNHCDTSSNASIPPNTADKITTVYITTNTANNSYYTKTYNNNSIPINHTINKYIPHSTKCNPYPMYPRG